jgi:hypothetical protein
MPRSVVSRAISKETHKLVPPEGDREASEQAKEPLRELTLGRSKPLSVERKPQPEGSTWVESHAADLNRIEARCRAKADAARWAAERQRRIHEGTDLQVENAPTDPELVEWAEKLTDCFYWLDTSPGSQSPEISILDHVGGCFETVAAALSLVKEHNDQRSGFERALNLLVEAQSGLRRALQRARAPDDPDQLEVYEWVRATAARRHIFLRRFMRVDDLAEPAGWTTLLSRIESMAKSDPKSQQQKALLGDLQLHLRLVREVKGVDVDWEPVIKDVEELVGAGVPPSHREIRELLLPVIDDLPDVKDAASSFHLVLREIDRYLATRTPLSAAPSAQVPSAEVREAARLLNCRSIVLIGGIRRPDAQKVLKLSLGLKELVWIETKEHQSIEGFESSIARPDVALILLAIRWSSHAFGDVKRFCDQHGKPLVRLPGGYSPNQVAAHILSQCSERLRME